MKVFDHMLGVEYEALQEFITQLLAYATSKKVSGNPLPDHDKEVQLLVNLKKHMSVSDDLAMLKDEITRKARLWNFPQGKQ